MSATDERQLRPPSSESLDAGYEKSTISVKKLAVFLLCLIGFAVVLHYGVWIVMREFVKADEKRDTPTSAMTDPAMAERYGGIIAPKQVPRSPWLQPSPPQTQPHVPEADLAAMYEQENSVFRRLGWSTGPMDSTRVQIPTSIVSKVIQDETARQEQSRKTPGAAH